MSPPSIEEWKIAVMRELGLKQKKVQEVTSVNHESMNKHLNLGLKDKLPKVKMPGQPVPQNKTGKFLAEQLFGSKKSRQTISEENKKKIDELHLEGKAAPVGISSGDRRLRGNFFSAKGHNLKSEEFKPDLSRPVVLLLTGSGGSAQDQGLDMAQMYSEGGASVLSVNFGGYGDSSDTSPSEQSINEDGQAMLEHLLLLGYKPEQIILHGFSMGATVSAQLQHQYEKKGMTFRGQVQDRPMPSAQEGVKSHVKGIGGTVAKQTEKELGSMDGKTALLNCDKLTRIVLTTDFDGDFGRRGELMREALLMQERLVTGTKSSGSHLENDKMLEKNKDPLLELVRKDHTGNVDRAVTTERLDLEVVFKDSVNELTETAKKIFPLISQGKAKKDGKLLKSARELVESYYRMRQQLDSTGLDKVECFKNEFLKLAGWTKKVDGYDKEIRTALLELTGTDEYLSEDFAKLVERATVKLLQFENQGGPGFVNKKTEEELLPLIEECEKTYSLLQKQKGFEKKTEAFQSSYEDLLSAKQHLLEQRNTRERKVEEFLSNISKVKRTLEPVAKQEWIASMQEDLKVFKGEGEDVSASRGLVKSSDKGFQKAVIKPVLEIIPKLENLIKEGKPITEENLPELAKVRLALKEAHDLYSVKRNTTDKKKDPKDWDQRNRKVLAIETRMDALEQILTKANDQATEVGKFIEKRKSESLEVLAKEKGVEQTLLLTKAIAGDMRSKPKDPLVALERQKRAGLQMQTVAKYLDNLDENQFKEVLRNRLEPDVLGIMLLNMSAPKAEARAKVILELFGDDPDYVETIVNSGVKYSFDTVKTGTKAMRGNDVITHLMTHYANSGTGADFTNATSKSTLEILKGQDLEIKPLDPPDPKKATQEELKNYLLYEKRRLENLQKHVKVFEKLILSIITRIPPGKITRIAASVYDSAFAKYGSADEALVYVGGFIMLRVVNPYLSTYFTKIEKDAKGGRAAVIQGKILQSLSNDVALGDKEPFMAYFNDVITKVKPLMKSYFKTCVNYGKASKDNMSPRDYAFDALRTPKTLKEHFAEPSEKDPLGTAPRDRTTVLGNSIFAARKKRDTSYKWEAIEHLRKNDRLGFSKLVYEERCEVLNQVIADYS